MADASLNQWRRQKALALSAVFGVLLVSCDERALPTQPTGGRALVPQGPPGLTITRVEPSSGPTDNSFPLMIHGTGFESGATVALGRLKAAVTSVMPTLITATVPEASQKNPADVVVTNPSGERATLVGGFRYVPTPPLTVSGRVLGLRATGERVPVPNLRLKVRAGLSGFGDSTPLADIVTDAQGRYTINDNSAFVLAFQTDPGSGYRFLCDWYLLVTRWTVREIEVVHTTWSGDRPPSAGFWGHQIWGTVSEQIDGSLQPVADVTVMLDNGVGDPPTRTSPNGFYSICSVVGADQLRTITASKTGYNLVTREFFNDSEIHLQLTRR